MENVIYKNLASLKPVELILREASKAINDKNRTIKQSDIKEILGTGIGIGIGAGIGAGSVALGAAAGTSGAAAMTSGLAAAGSIVGGGMMAGIAVAAAPAVLLGIGGYTIVSKYNQQKLAQEKEMLFQEALRKRDSILKMLNNKQVKSQERLAYLSALNIKLTDVIENLKQDRSI